MRLSHQDHMRLQRELCALYGHMDLDAFPGAAVHAVSQLVRCNMAAYNEVDPVRRRIVAVIDPPESQARAVALLPQWERLMHQHPLVNHFRDNPHDEPRRISDFLPQRQFEQLDIYREIYHHIDARYQIVTTMPAPSPLVVGIAQNRQDRDFSERDRTMLAMLRPHLRQAYENACVVSDLVHKAWRLEQVIDQLDRAVVLLDELGGVKQASASAIRYAAEYLPSEQLTALHLPETMRRWAIAQIAALQQPDAGASRPGPLALDGSNGRLILRLVPDVQPGQYVLVMHRAAKLDSPAPLRGMGLTAREAEVLYWCIEGKSRGEIGLSLKISERTVEKHLEHIYTKLDVPNRVSAVTKAIEWLR